MPVESTRTRIVRLVTQTARWRLRSNRQTWLILSALVIATCAEAIAIPAKRGTLACAAAGLIGMGLWITGRRRQRREREALAARLAAVSRDDIPAEVVNLVAAGRKIQAVRRCRELTGASLQEAKVIIDSL
jgi:ribosomal protein L7/L12